MSTVGHFLKKYLSISPIKATFTNIYRKTCGFYVRAHKMAKKIYETDDTKAYTAFTGRVCKRMLRAFRWAWAAFGIVLTYMYATQGLSLLFEGYSGTMTVEFTSQWLVVAIWIAGFIFCLIGAEAIYGSIQDFKEVRRKLKVSTNDKDVEKYVTVNVFEQFKDEVKNEFKSINSRLDNVERLLSHLVKNQEAKNSNKQNE